ncbi:MAG TPA: lysozyme inhibitor LprI family protein [Puia sp.]|jgi:hypothetical protein
MFQKEFYIWPIIPKQINQQIFVKLKIGVLINIILFISILSYGQNTTQRELTAKYGDIAKNSEKKMDSIYKRILRLYADDTLFVKNFKTSQITWQKYFFAQEAALYPKYPSGRYGSMLSMCVSDFAQKLIEIRIHELENWLIGSDEADCPSSIKPKQELPKYVP